MAKSIDLGKAKTFSRRSHCSISCINYVATTCTCIILSLFAQVFALLLYYFEGLWPGCLDSMKSPPELNRAYSHDTVFKFSLLETHLVLHDDGNGFPCMEITPKKLMMWTDL